MDREVLSASEWELVLCTGTYSYSGNVLNHLMFCFVSWCNAEPFYSLGLNEPESGQKFMPKNINSIVIFYQIDLVL